VVLGGDRLVQVQGAAADQTGAVVAGQRGPGGDRTTARLLGVAVVMGTGGGVDGIRPALPHRRPRRMRGQLRHLLAVMPLASVSLGIIPFTAQRTVWPLEAFYLHDNTMAVAETLTAEIKVTQPRELADYAKAFAGLAEMAVYGGAARTLIRAAVDALE
jgi:hypothetical protein